MRIRGRVGHRRGGSPRAIRAGIAGAATLGLTLAGVTLTTGPAPAADPQLRIQAASASLPAPEAVPVAASVTTTAAVPEPTTSSTVAPTSTSTVAAPPPTTTSTVAPPPPASTTTVAKPEPVAPAAPEVDEPQPKPPAGTGLLSLLEVARHEVGGPEERYTTSWGFSAGFWCAKFVSWSLAHAGIDLREDGPGDFRFVVDRVDVPVPGDLVFIDLVPEQSTGQPTHIGIVESVNADGSVISIEGNADDSGLVTRQLRSPDEIVGFGRAPAPTSTTVIPAPEAGPEADCVWIEIGKPWLCDWEP